MKKAISIFNRSKKQRTPWLMNSIGVAVVCAFLTISGCATVGNDFPEYRVGRIKMGKTTQKEVRDLFGSPWRVGVEDGQETWTYGRYRYALFSETKTKDLVIRFDERKVVASYTFNTTEHNE